MNLLPDMIIIDFCEWLNSILPLKRNGLDFYDLMLDEENHRILEEYADVYLRYQRYRFTIKKLLHRFIDSEEFDKCLNEDEQLRQFRHTDIREFYYCLCCGHIDKHFEHFIYKAYGIRGRHFKICDFDSHFSAEEHNIEPYELANSVSYVFSHFRDNSQIASDKKWILQLINHAKLNVDIEVEFLEWLIQSNGEPIDFRKMPLRTFELLAQKFQNECGKSENEKQKLIRSFKQTNILILSEKLAAVLPLNTAKRAKDLGYIIKRYNDQNVRFKCFIVPLQADSAEYIELMEKRWYDLHYLSGDYLDIYYSKADYGRSGYEIAQKMSYIPKSLKTKAPLIILWENDLNEACGIDISRLNNVAIFEVIRYMVNLIREGRSFNMIVQEANQMCKELRDEQRPVTYATTNTVTIKDNATVIGPVAGENSGNMVFQSNERINEADVLNELEAAKEIIYKFSDINERQKQLLAEIIDEAKNAIKDNSTDKKVDSKKHFKNAIDLIGIGGKLISALSGLTNVLKFFGYSPV